jgi:hypothetical protein
MDHVLRSPLEQCHLGRRQNELLAQVRLHRPAHDLSAEDVEHHGQVQDSRPTSGSIGRSASTTRFRGTRDLVSEM